MCLTPPPHADRSFAKDTIAGSLKSYKGLRLLLPGSILVLGWSLSVWFFTLVVDETRLRRQEFLQGLASDSVVLIQRRMIRYEEALRGTAAFLSTQKSLSKASWEQFSDNLEIHRRLPGIKGITVVDWVERSAIPAFEQRMRAEAWPDFVVRATPGSEAPANCAAYVVSFITPLQGNEEAIGLDLSSETRRRQAAERARTSGEPAMTHHIRLVQDSKERSGFILYLPVFQADPVTHERSFKCWVNAPFVWEQLLDDLFAAKKPMLEFSITELGAGGERIPVYHTKAWAEGSASLSMPVKLYGVELLTEWQPGAAFPTFDEHGQALAAATLVLMSVLLAGLVHNLHRSRALARELVETTTRDLAAATARAEAAAQLQGAVLNGTPYSIVASDAEGIIEVFNAGAQRMLGYSAEELIGKRTPILFHLASEVNERATELSALFKRPVKSAFEALVGVAVFGQVDQREWTYVRKDGRYVPVLLSVTRLHDTKGQTAGFVGIAYDLTERRQAEDALRRSQNHLLSIFSALSEGLVMQDPTGAILESNSAAERILGLTREQLSGSSALDPQWRALRPDGSAFPSMEHPAMLTLRTGQPQRAVVMAIHKPDGSKVWVSINSHPVADAKGSIVAVVCSYSDITQRRIQEHQLRASMMEIINLKTALDEHAIVAITDRDGIITYVNERFCRVSKYSQEELVGRNHRIVNSGAHAPEVFKRMWTQISSGQVWRGELNNRAKDGSLYWVDATIVPFLGDDGQTEQFVAIQTDITERKRLDAEIGAARDEALESSRLKSEFLATMSHEIRTPMNGVIGMTELLIASLQSEAQREMGRTIQSCARNLLVILNDILDFSKIEAGHMSIHLEPFAVADVFREVVLLMEPKAVEKGIRLSSAIDPGVVGVYQGDSNRLRQILSNLLNNALKFTEHGTVTVKAEMLACEGPKDALLRFEVQDTGIGIPDTTRERLFQPFVQGDGSVTRRFGGTGLGLAICRRLVELMQGRIGVESVEGRGSLFWVELPLDSVDQEPAVPLRVGAPAGEDAKLDDAVSAQRLHLLVAEDTPVNQIVVRLMLEKLGHTCELAEDGVQALSLLAKTSFDGVLLDCQMPVLDGYQVAKRIRGRQVEGVRPDIPLVALTAFAMVEDRAKCLEAGMDDYLSKPLELDALKAALERLQARLG